MSGLQTKWGCFNRQVVLLLVWMLRLDYCQALRGFLFSVLELVGVKGVAVGWAIVFATSHDADNYQRQRHQNCQAIKYFVHLIDRERF